MTSNVKYSYKHLTFRSVTVLYSSNESYFCRLLHVQNANCKYTEADLTCQIAGQTLKELQALGLPVNAAAFYTECCALLFAECQYDEVRCSRWVESSFFHSYVGSLYYVPMSCPLTPSTCILHLLEKSYLSRLGLPMDWEKIFENENNTLYCSISHWEEKCLFFSLLIFGLTQQRDTIDLTFCKTGQVYYRIQLNRKLRIFFSWKMMSQNES